MLDKQEEEKKEIKDELEYKLLNQSHRSKKKEIQPAVPGPKSFKTEESETFDAYVTSVKGSINTTQELLY